MPPERHELRHRDGRRLLIYGDLRGSLADEPPLEAAQATDLHQRLDRLRDAWIAVSPARNTRPDQSDAPGGERAGCPFCPGGFEVPFDYDAAVFENRFPSLVAAPPEVADDPRLRPALGRCEVVLYTARHDASFGSLTGVELGRLMEIWQDRSLELWADARHRYVLTFENRGAAVGATIAHPHGQIYAFDHLPEQVERMATVLARARESSGRCLTCEVVAEDLREPGRRVLDGGAFSVAVPFAPRLPFEVHVRARRHGVGRLGDLAGPELGDLGSALQRVAAAYDALFGFELPYMLVALEAPPAASDWHLAFELLPLHRSASLVKIRASVETATGTFINDTVPEASAARLREAVERASAGTSGDRAS